VTVVRRRSAHRRLVADGHTYLWWVRHSHAEPECQEIVTLRRYGTPGHARIAFRTGPGGIVGGGAYLHGGAVVRAGSVPGAGAYLNLHRPATARALLDEVLAAGWEPGEEREFDGWEVVDAVLGR
jgi:hypothetical protein